VSKENKEEQLAITRDALAAFCYTVETLGGVFMDADDWPRPVGDPDWADLGRAYVDGCKVLGWEVKISPRKQDYDPRA